jgi:hypothetical protein
MSKQTNETLRYVRNLRFTIQSKALLQGKEMERPWRERMDEEGLPKATWN